MIKILVVTHGNLGKEFINSSQFIMGPVEGVESISFSPGDSYEQLCKSVGAYIENIRDDNLIVFTDMYGGSPFNAVSKFMKNRDFFHITGINLPLYIDIVINKDTYSMEEIAEKIIKNGKKSMVFVNERFIFD